MLALFCMAAIGVGTCLYFMVCWIISLLDWRDRIKDAMREVKALRDDLGNNKYYLTKDIDALRAQVTILEACKSKGKK